MYCPCHFQTCCGIIIKAASEECRSWIKAINDRKGAAIRENLGHAPANSNVKAFNRAGAALFDSTLRKDATSTVNPMQSQ